MEPKPSLLRNILVRVFFFCVLVIGVRFAYIITIRGESCELGDFCFFSLPENLNLVTGISQVRSSAIIVNDAVRSSPAKSMGRDLSAVGYYSSVFQDLIAESYLSPDSKSLCVDTPNGDEVYALKEIGVSDSIGIYKKASKPLVISGQAIRQPFDENTFDFIFSGGGGIDKSSKPAEFAAEQLVRNAEPLITEEPPKPWITLKRNIKNIKYLASMADISFKQRYVYVDVGARSYGSSIVSWFKKQYPKQNKTFEIYAIEADKAFHEEYRYKKGVTLLPYAAWVRNETLSFEVNGDPGREKEEKEKGRGMGRIKPVQSSASVVGDVDKIQGFDFANWLKSTVSEKDFVVMKMDVEGTEFDLIPKLFETGAICLIDEIFLECHYNRWQKCCPGERSSKYQKTYGQCLELFNSLRQSGVLVHQWW
ncbi:hypothetical protein Acr_02g0007220 [Actinidia rufa]|uniref:DUF7870 domain-containing protein n=1 Tax=Actinidia rufa TaxID=165716 RepID=A0A7J0E867_9ERIC|nr:hypothetical protein Acr_02g0007220 [Actinidia rufa]